MSYKTVEDVEKRFNCKHATTRLTYRVYSNGATHFTEQCVRCGDAVQSVRKDSISVKDRRLAPAFNEKLRRDWRTEKSSAYAERRAHWNSARDQVQIDRRKQYSEYLKSEKWHDKRQRVLERDGYLCQACRKRRAKQVHHITYERIFDEPLFDLVAICKTCHDHLHDRSESE